MMKSAPVQTLIKSLFNTIKTGVEYGIGDSDKPTDAFLESVRTDVFLFSGMKAFHEMKETSFLIMDENGNTRSKEEFMQLAGKIDEAYNKRYLSVEYDFAITSANNAKKWLEFEEDGDRYHLQYRTMADNRVRQEHAALDMITLPITDKFWDSYMPPNGWNCRCEVVQVIPDKYGTSDSKASIALGEKATSGKGARFRFNPGKDEKIFPPRHGYNIDKCKTCKKKNGISLRAEVPDSELCAACDIIRKEGDGYTKIPTKNGSVRIHSTHNKGERKENMGIATLLADKLNYHIDILPIIRDTKNADSYNHTLKKKQEYKCLKTNTINAVDMALKSAKKQADSIVLQIDKTIDYGVLENGMKGRVSRAQNITDITLIIDDQILIFSREDILQNDFLIKKAILQK